MKDFQRYATDPMGFIRSLVIPTILGPRPFKAVMQQHQRDRLKSLVPDLLAVASGSPPPGGRHWWETSKGTSKTSDVACAVIWLCVFAQKPLNMMAGAVDRDNAAELIKSAKAILHENAWLNDLVDVQAWAIAGRHTGVVCEVVAADKKGSHGSKPAVTFIDECGHVPDDRWEFVSNMLDNASKVAGIVICATNAGWLDTEAYKLRELARTSQRWQFHQWAKPSPLMPVAEIEEAKLRNSPSRFNRLFHGVWGPKNEGDALNSADLQKCITLAGPTPTLPSGWILPVAAVDLGLRHDRTGFAAVAVDSLHRVALLETKSWKAAPGGEVNVGDVEQHILHAHRRYKGFARVMFDPWQFSASAQRLLKCGLPMQAVHSTTANADMVAIKIPAAFRDKHIAIYPDDELLTDLGKFSIVEKTAPGFAAAYKLVAPRDSSGHADVGQAFLMAATMGLVYADTLRTRDAITAIQEHEERAKTGGRGANWGAPVGDFPGAYDSPRPDLAAEYGYRKSPPPAAPSVPPIVPWRP